MSDDHINLEQLHHQLRQIEGRINYLSNSLHGNGNGIKQEISRIDSDIRWIRESLNWFYENEDDLRALVRSLRDERGMLRTRSIVDAVDQHRQVDEETRDAAQSQYHEMAEQGDIYKWVLIVMALWTIYNNIGCHLNPNLPLCG